MAAAVVVRLHATDDGECCAGRNAVDARRFTQQRVQVSSDDDAWRPAAAAAAAARLSAGGSAAGSFGNHQLINALLDDK